MDRRGIAEIGGAALACEAAAAITFRVVAGTIDWLLVVGIGITAAIAAAANYQARTAHSNAVADSAPQSD